MRNGLHAKFPFFTELAKRRSHATNKLMEGIAYTVKGICSRKSKILGTTHVLLNSKKNYGNNYKYIVYFTNSMYKCSNKQFNWALSIHQMHVPIHMQRLNINDPDSDLQSLAHQLANPLCQCLMELL